MEIKKYAHGMFSWTDLSTSDADAAKRFYGELFGWTPVDVPAGPDMTYTMMRKNDRNVCALYTHANESPSHWLSYITVEDLEAVTQRAESFGAKIVRSPMDVMDAGRMALLQDPSGAMVALWQAKAHAGAALRNETNTVCWHELQTHDVDRAGGFYIKLLGWNSKSSGMGHEQYTEFSVGTSSVAGMMQIAPEWGQVLPNWMVYFQVSDCEKMAKKVKTLGGQVHVQPRDVPDVGRFCVVADPQGATFAMIQMRAS